MGRPHAGATHRCGRCVRPARAPGVRLDALSDRRHAPGHGKPTAIRADRNDLAAVLCGGGLDLGTARRAMSLKFRVDCGNVLQRVRDRLYAGGPAALPTPGRTVTVGAGPANVAVTAVQRMRELCARTPMNARRPWWSLIPAMKCGSPAGTNRHGRGFSF